MKLERRGKKLYADDLVGFEVADCDTLTNHAVECIVQNNNFGEEVAHLYTDYRGEISLSAALHFLEKMEALYKARQAALRSARSGITITEAM